MGFFNFIETSFFVSLGITFILILLMVYHFKERLSGLEQKGDTMFEIINNIVREMTNLKNAVIMQSQQAAIREQSYEHHIPIVNETYSNTPIYKTYENKIIQEEYSDSEESTDSEESDDSSDSSDSESESNHNVIDIRNISIQNENTLENKHEPVYVQMDSPVSGEQILDVSTDSVKIINIHMEDYTEGDNESKFQTLSNDNEDSNKEEDASESEDSKEDSVSNSEESDKEASINEELVHSPNNKINTPIYVSKLEDDSDGIVESHQEEKKESYKDLTIQQLKAIVISKGITTSVSKLKKNELIQLLENY